MEPWGTYSLGADGIARREGTFFILTRMIANGGFLSWGFGPCVSVLTGVKA
jgi:hypothetical protein